MTLQLLLFLDMSSIKYIDIGMSIVWYKTSQLSERLRKKTS